MKSLFTFSVLLACLGIFCLAPNYVQGAPAILKLATPHPENEIAVEHLRNVFKKYVEEKSQGRLKVDIYANAALGNTNTVFQGLQFGTVDIMFDSVSNLALFAPALSLCDLPYMFPDIPSIRTSLDSPAGQALFEPLEKKNAVVLGTVVSSFRYIISTSPITKLEDIQGLKLRTTSSKSHITGINSLGMAATPMASSEMLTGLQQGVVKGLDPDITTYYAQKLYELAPHFFASEHIPVVYLIAASKRFLSKLPEQDRKIVEEGMTLYCDTLMNSYTEFNEKALKDLVENKGCTLVIPSDEEKTRWMKKSKVAYDQLSGDLQEKAQALHKAAWGN